jgi:hypothetical protein
MFSFKRNKPGSWIAVMPWFNQKFLERSWQNSKMTELTGTRDRTAEKQFTLTAAGRV